MTLDGGKTEDRRGYFFARAWAVAVIGAIFPVLAGTAVHAATPPEHATYDSSGRLLSLLHEGEKIPAQAELQATFEGGVIASLQAPGHPPALKRAGPEHRWQGEVAFPNSSHAAVTVGWDESSPDTTTLDGAVTATTPLDTQSVEWVLDLPRAIFSGGRLVSAQPAAPVDLPVTKPEQTTFFRAATDTLVFVDASNAHRLTVRFDRTLTVSVTDRWDADGRSFRVRALLHHGLLDGGERVAFHAALSLTGPTPSAPAANLSVDFTKPRYEFDGYGGNFCWGEQPAASTYLLDHLQPAWTRHELKARDWDRERDHPGPALVQDFEQMAAVQKRGIPWILTVWNLPQRFYADANEHPPDVFFHPVAWDRWDELLDLLGSYLLYLKAHYGAEPTLFSFNEPDLGIYVGQTPEAHRDAIKRLGAHFVRLGLKTKLLLGDTSDARDTHRFALPSASDADAMRYVGAVSFHSWRPTKPAQYEAWADLADWLHLPLLVAETGVDPDAYYNQAFDSYDYGLSEAAQQQSILRYARPSASIFWQYTTDYGLVHVLPDGTVEPTRRFWLWSHFANATPRHSQVLVSSSDQPDVLISAFRRDQNFSVHLLNLGPARSVTLTGMPPGKLQTLTTTESVDYLPSNLEITDSTRLQLPARSLTTLIR